MSKFLSHSIIGLVAIALVVGIFAVPLPAHANVITDQAVKVLANLQNAMITTIADATLRVAGFFTWISAWLLNFSLDVSVINMKTHIDNLDALDIGWKAFRDLSNMFFIFILLYISIATILRLEGYNARSLLAKVIIIALLINFSLFFTKVIVDASNRLAIEFYNATGIAGKVENGRVWNNGFAEKLMTSTRIGTIYNFQSGGVAAGGNGAAVGVSSTRGVADVITKPIELYTLAIGGTVFLLVLAFIFFAAGFLLLGRFIMLVILMVLSPLAYMAMILPSTRGLASRWWRTLMDQALFAPLFLMLVWFSLHVVNSPGFGQISRVDDPNVADTFVGAFVGRSPELILNYVLAIGFLIAALYVSRSFSALGAGMVMKWGDGARRWGQGIVGRATIGQAGKTLGRMYRAGEASIKNTAAGRGFTDTANRMTLGLAGNLNRATKRALDAGRDAKFGSSQNLADVRKTVRAEDANIQGAIRDEDRVISQRNFNLREALINPGIADRVRNGTATPAELKSFNRYQETWRTATKSDLDAMSVKDITSASGMLSEGQMKAIDGSERSDADKQKIWDARLGDVKKAIRRNNTDEIKAAVRNVTDYDLEHLNADELANSTFLGALGSKKVEKIMKSERHGVGTKAQIKQTRLQKLQDAIRGGVANDMRSALQSFSATEAAGHLDRLSDDDLRDVAEQVPAKVLKAGIEEISPEKRATLRGMIEGNPHAAAESWFDDNPESVVF